jgi:hypothetical protein
VPLADARQDRLPELFGPTPPAGHLYHRHDRNGVSVVAIRQRDLAEEQIAAILRYRLANALLNGDVDPQSVQERGADHEWWFPGQADDVHVLAGATDTGEIASYIALAFLPGVEPWMTLQSSRRPRFEVEDVFGTRVYDGIARLEGVPLSAIAEARRFVRTRWLHPLSEIAIRAPIELGIAFWRVLAGPLAESVAAVVADVEAIGAHASLRRWGIPHVSLEDARPVTQPRSYPGAVREVRAYPVALFTADVPTAADRMAAVEAALARPSREGVDALLRRMLQTSNLPQRN